MKITCEYCTNSFNDTEETCPHCGAPNPNVVRSTKSQPKTIKDLEDWYKSKGLPPYEVTRFFIGENHKGPRAFGIYKDPKSGNFIVYKNKDNGQRAVRYEGTDEAYAVNELFMRLKQEIIQQKMNNVKKSTSKGSSVSGSPSRPSRSPLRKLFRIISGLVIGFIALITVSVIYVTYNDMKEPADGYYSYGNDIFYHSPSEYGSSNWFRYESDSGDYVPLISGLNEPAQFGHGKQAKECFLSTDWDASYGCPDFTDTQWNEDTKVPFYPDKGYYVFDDVTYYHLVPYSTDMWYEYKNGWNEVDYGNLPSDMKHASLADKYYIGENYSTALAADDFTKTLYYQDYMIDEIDEGYYRAGDEIYYHLGSYYGTDWYSYNSIEDDWEYVDKSHLPDALSHASTVDDFYFTPTWDASTQFSDFTDSSAYEAATSTNDDSDDGWSSSDDSYDYSWGSNDSWDSGGSDWDSDW